MNEILDKVDKLFTELQSLSPLKPENQKALDKKFRLEFNFNSNHLEGNTLTYGETELLLIFDDASGPHTLREFEEMKAHDIAFNLIEDWAKDKERPLTEQNIKNLNEIILVRPFWKDAITPEGGTTRRQISIGNYKEYPNSVRLANGEIFDYASPTDTPIKMHELMDWYRTQESLKNPVVLAAELHYNFVRIHPFDDGNGRISRLLMNYVLLRNNYPPIIIKTEDKPAYLRALNEADAGNRKAFVEYIAEQLIWSLELALKAAKGESLDEPDDLDKELYLLDRELNSEDVLKSQADFEIVAETIEKNILPLCRLLEQKSESLSKYFFDSKRDITYNVKSMDNSSNKIGNNRSNWDDICINWLQNSIRRNSTFIKKFHYSFELKGYKKTVEAQQFRMDIEVQFSDYNYQITTSENRNRPLQLPYGKILSKEELLKLVTPLIQKLIENIRQLNARN